MFLPNLRFFASPYFDSDAFMHNALHRDASAWKSCLNAFDTNRAGMTCTGSRFDSLPHRFLEGPMLLSATFAYPTQA